MDNLIRDWMRSGFMKPSDLAKKSKIIQKELTYLPFWVISCEAQTKYKGIFERIAPAIVKEGEIKKKYNWLVLARQASDFPTQSYDVPLEGKVPYDFRKIEGYAKVLNSEVEKEQAVDMARQQIDVHHRFLLQEDVDRIVEATTNVTPKQMLYLHAPVWSYARYKGNITKSSRRRESMVLKGDIPSSNSKPIWIIFKASDLFTNDCNNRELRIERK
jgi:hypothetical protein